MSIQKLNPEDFEVFTLELHPSRQFSSSSTSGATGSIYVFPRNSPSEKEAEKLSSFTETKLDDASLAAFLANVSKIKKISITNINSYMSQYLTRINQTARSERKQKTLQILRYEPSLFFSSESLRKSAIRELTYPFYRCVNPSMNWAFTNYNSLNFFTASSVPDNSVLLYPNLPPSGTQLLSSGAYTLSGAFTFDFWINPRYTVDEPNGTFKAGTIFHLSSSYAVSLISGSSKDVENRANKFRIALQLSHSADIKPSLIDNTSRNYPRNLIFLSDDNSLDRNTWHHVSIRWGGSNIQNGTGSFVIDGQERGNFTIPSASITPLARTDTNPDVLCVGNFYEGSNLGANKQAFFFSTTPALRHGLREMLSVQGIDGPTTSIFSHPLNAEVHDLKIFGKYFSIREIGNLTGSGLKDLANYKRNHNLLFYAPPFFTKESPKRREISELGGVLRTPFAAYTSRTTTTPFNTDLSFGVGGHELNLENFLRDFATGYYPRPMQLTASQINGSTEVLTANQFLYATASLRKRNLTILPCDNGNFYPNFELLLSGNIKETPSKEDPTSLFVDDLGVLNLSFVSLNEMVPTSSIQMAFTQDSGSLVNQVVGVNPSSLLGDPTDVLAVLQRTRDNSSNEVVFFDISNLYYGNQIQPETFEIIDPNVSGSNGKVKITLKDDGFGNLYRADSEGEHAQWNSVGNLLYNEGIAVVKSPVVPFFGKDSFELNLRGTQNIHVMKVNVIAPAGQLNSSSNPNYKLISASLDANDFDNKFVYITGINFLDKDFNIVMKTQLAQPIMKRTGTRIAFKVKVDF